MKEQSLFTNLEYKILGNEIGQEHGLYTRIHYAFHSKLALQNKYVGLSNL